MEECPCNSQHGIKPFVVTIFPFIQLITNNEGNNTQTNREGEFHIQHKLNQEILQHTFIYILQFNNHCQKCKHGMYSKLGELPH